MRVLLAALLILTALTLGGAVQSAPRFGVEVGVDMANTTGNGWDVLHNVTGNEFDNKSRTGLVAGVVARFPLPTAGLALQSEVLYVEKGSKVTYTVAANPMATATETSSFVANYKFSYIEIPVTLRYAVPTGGPVSPALFAGPFLSVNRLLPANWRTRVSYEDVPQELRDGSVVDFNDTHVGNAASAELGLSMGAGVDVSLGPKGTLFLNVRYTLGLSRMTDDIGSVRDFPKGDVALINYETEDGLNLKNSDFRLMAGYLF